MSTSAEPWQPLLDAFAQLRAAWPASDWTWDPRFKCVTSSLPATDAESVGPLLKAVVPNEWTAISFASAPEPVRALEARCGDLRPGQLLFTGQQIAGMVPFAMWWPWGDNSKISVRLSIANSDRPKELYPLVRSLFGIA
ncbi:MAG: hypothetical protein ABIS92_18215 [Polyangia bacterium]